MVSCAQELATRCYMMILLIMLKLISVGQNCDIWHKTTLNNSISAVLIEEDLLACAVRTVFDSTAESQYLATDPNACSKLPKTLLACAVLCKNLIYCCT